MDQYQYLAVMAACLVLTLPLELVFGARVYRRPRLLAAALVPALVIFVIWDVIAIARGHWSYAERYVTGVVIPPNLPLEELTFFVVIPICGLLTFEASRRILSMRRQPKSHVGGR